MSDQEEYECTVRIRNFSDENVHRPGSEAAVEMEAGEDAFFHVFANGMGAEDEGYVTIDFLDSVELYCETSCVVSVLDASGNRRFPTSCMLSFESENDAVSVERIHPFIMDRVVKRETLLEQPDELLPEDCLTLHIHIFTKPIIFEDDIVELLMTFECILMGDQYVRLPLDSVVAKRLMGVSPYFRALSEAPMVERQRGYARFSGQEYRSIRIISDILLDKKVIIIHSVEDLLKIYTIADKYDVLPVIESYRGILSALLCAAKNDPIIEGLVMDKITDFSVPVDEISDSRLREIFENFLERNREDRDQDSGTEESAADQLETEWRLDHVDETYSYFTFRRDAQRREDEFKFYQ